MAIALEQTVDNNGNGTSIVLTSWTPGADELVLVGVATINTGLTPSVSGNGLTFVQVASIENVDGSGEAFLFRAMGSSPTTGSITVTLTGNSECAIAIAARFSGVDTSGTDGSGAIEATETASAPAGGNDDMKDDITTLTNDAWAIGFSNQESVGFTLPAGETAIKEDAVCFDLPDILVSSMWYEEVATPTTVTLGGNNDLGGINVDWCMISVSVREPQPADDINFNPVKRRRLNQLVAA